MFEVVELGGWLALLAKILGSIGAAFGAWKSVIYFVPKNISVKKITNPDDDDFVEMFRLHEHLFKNHVADDYADLQRWIQDAERIRKERKHSFDDILLVTKDESVVVGYLYATYYKTSSYMFVSYLAIDDSSINARRMAACKLLQHLLKYAKKHRYKWRAVIAEVEEFEKVSYENEESYEPHARKIMRVFQHAVRKIAKKYKVNTDLYRILCEYHQPALRPGEIDQYDRTDPRDYKQWLLYIPRDESEVISVLGGRFLSKQTVLGVIKFIFLKVYLDAYATSRAYDNYLKRKAFELGESIPEMVQKWSKLPPTGDEIEPVPFSVV